MKIRILAILLFFTLLPISVRAGEAEETMRKIRAGWEAVDEESQVHAVTVTGSGRSGLPQEFTLWQAWKTTGQDLARIKFTGPRHMEGIQLLTEGERQWLRSPPFKVRPVRFDKGEGGTEFAQTAFTHEDLRSLDLQTYRYAVEGNKLIATPAKVGESAYSRLELLVDRSRWVITEIRYFDMKGVQVKTLTNSGWQEACPGIWRPRSIQMVNIVTGRRTDVTVTYKGFQRLPGRVFSPAELNK